MLRALLFIVKLAVLVLVAVWLANRPGDVVLEWFGYRVETSVGILLLAALLVGVAAGGVLRDHPANPRGCRRFGLPGSSRQDCSVGISGHPC